MSEAVGIEEAKRIMGPHFVGPEELRSIDDVQFDVPTAAPTVPFTREALLRKREDYILILGVGTMNGGTPVTIASLRRAYGMDPNRREPCFYNQDWYDVEDFAKVQMWEGWFLIRRDVYESSRAVQPDELMKRYTFPNAISCTFAFFVAWAVLGIVLWEHDFIWCSDVDHNGDRIYVGRYSDPDGINKSGFNIHRHLSLRPCYACID